MVRVASKDIVLLCQRERRAARGEGSSGVSPLHPAAITVVAGCTLSGRRNSAGLASAP